MRRRTGTVTREGDVYRARVTSPKGRPTLGRFASEEDARVALEAHAAVVAELEPSTGETLGTWGEKWLTGRELARNIRDPKGDWSRWRVHVAADEVAAFDLRDLRRRDVLAWVARVRRSVSAQTTRNALALVRGALGAALDEELVTINVALRIKVAGEKRTEEPWTYMAPEEQSSLILAAPEKLRWIIAFAIGTGLRAGELVSLRLVDVHADDASPFVTVRYGGAPSEPTKTGKIRRVPLFGLGLQAAREWLQALPAYAKSNPHGLAFPGPNGGFRAEEHVLRWDLWRSVLASAGLTRRVRWHDLRHTCASSLISGSWGPAWRIEDVSALLGHSSIALTQRYAHLAPTALTRAAARMPAGAFQTDAKRTNGGQMRGIALDSKGFLNRWPAVRLCPGAPNDSEMLRSEGADASVRLASVSLALLRAVAAGDEERAGALALELSAGVLAVPLVALARAVAEGGEHATARAVDLATAILESSDGRDAKTGGAP